MPVILKIFEKIIGENKQNEIEKEMIMMMMYQLISNSSAQTVAASAGLV